MARIRSIHPGQWRDVDFVECSFPARLLAIGLRNEADDQGVFEWKPKQLTMNLFPADAINIEPLLSELTINNVVTLFEIDGRKYGVIRNFRKYQRPKSPNCIHPLPEQFRKYVGLDAIPISEIDDDEAEPVPKAAEQMEEGGGNRRRNTSSLRSDVSAGADAPPKPDEVRQAFDAYNAVAERTGWPAAEVLTEARRRKIRTRLRTCGGIDGWRSAMRRAEQSPFLRGETGRNGDHANWTPDLDFFLQEKSFTRLMEGAYDHRESASASGFTAAVRGFAAAAADLRRPSG